jgi:hypothetical protein
MKPNTDLLYATLDAVLAADVAGTWKQGSWIDVGEPYAADENMCRTNACFAGWSLLIQGGQILTRRASEGEGTYISAYAIQMDDGEVVDAFDVATKAQRALGLTEYQAEALFAGGNTLTHLKEIVDEIAARA